MASDVLTDCLVKTKELNIRLTRLTRKTQEDRLRQGRENILVDLYLLGQAPIKKCKSLYDLGTIDVLPVIIVEQLVDEMVDTVEELGLTAPVLKKIRACHQCHSPVSDPAHAGVQSGVGVCSLEHWDGCSGGIKGGNDAHGKSWAACPEDTSEDSETLSQTSLDDEVSSKMPADSQKVLAYTDSLYSEQLLAKPETVLIQDSDLESEEEASKEELILRQEEIKKLQKQIRQQEQIEAEKATEKLEMKRRRQEKLALDKANLEEEARELRAVVAGFSAPGASSLAPPPATATSSGNVMSSTGTKQKVLSQKVAEQEARQQHRAAEKLAKRQLEQSQALGLSMEKIRSVPDVRNEVEAIMSRLKEFAPTLASDKTASGFASQTIQPSVHEAVDGNRRQPKITPNYVYVAELGGVVPVVERMGDVMSPDVHVGTVDLTNDGECSPDEDCAMEPTSGFRFAWKRYPGGNKYFTTVEEEKDYPPDQKKEYVLDKKTGRFECRLVAADKTKKALKPARTAEIHYQDHRVGSASFLARGTGPAVQPVLQRDDRMASYVHSDSEKQGKGLQVPELVKHARDCPVHWTDKVTTQTMNIVLWSWAFISQLLATRIGQAPALQDGELEARLQHFLSVLEITLQITNQSDFASEAWKIARLYHTKVQQKVDSGNINWLQMYEQWGGSTLPHELMAANAEAAPAFKQGKKPRIEEGPYKVAGTRYKDDNYNDKYNDKYMDDKNRRLCPTWNKSETRGKCEWEIDNEGEKCKFTHHCVYCKSKKLNPVNHQRHFCKRRLEDDDE